MMPRVLLAAVAAALLVAGPAVAAFTDAAANRSSAARAAAAFAPRPGTPPTITGAAREGETLTATEGAWSRQPEHFAYQWLRCDAAGDGCTAIGAASAATYTPSVADVDATLRVRVVASNAGGSAAATSGTVGPIRRGYAAEVLLDRPSTYLRLDGNRTATVGASASAHGSTGFATTAGNQAATFAPPSALGVSASAVATAGTVELWFAGGSGVLVGTQDAAPFGTASGYAPLLYVDTSGNLRAGRFDTSFGARIINSGKRVDDGAWHHVALTRSGTTLRLYLDGAQVGSVVASGAWSVQTGATLGSGVAESTWWPGTGAAQQHWQHYTGQIDEFATYPAVLSQARLQAHIAAATRR